MDKSDVEAVLSSDRSLNTVLVSFTPALTEWKDRVP